MPRRLKIKATHLGYVRKGDNSTPIICYFVEEENAWRSASTGFRYNKETGLALGLSSSSWHFRKLDVTTVRLITPQDNVPYKRVDLDSMRKRKQDMESRTATAPFFKVYKSGILIATVRGAEDTLLVFKALKAEAVYIGSKRLCFHKDDLKKLGTETLIKIMNEKASLSGALITRSPNIEGNIEGNVEPTTKHTKGRKA